MFRPLNLLLFIALGAPAPVYGEAAVEETGTQEISIEDIIEDVLIRHR